MKSFLLKHDFIYILCLIFLTNIIQANTIHSNYQKDTTNTRIIFTGHLYPLVIHDLSYYLANEINLKKPDLVVLGGDLITGKDINHNGHNNWNKNIYCIQFVMSPICFLSYGINCSVYFF